MLRKILLRLLQRVRPKEKPDRNQWVAISISFVLAVTLWFLVTLNTQEFNSTFDLPVKFVNVPDDIQLGLDFPSTLSVESRGKGIELLNEIFEGDHDTIRIDFPTFRNQEFFIASNNVTVINRALRNEIRAVKVSPDSIPLSFGKRISRRVPVHLDFQLDMPLGFRNILRPTANVDSVTISGPQRQLDTLSFWRTERGPFPVAGKGVLTVPMEVRPQFTVRPRTVKVPVEPLAYTERSLRVPVFPANLPSDTRLRLTPDSVNIGILVPISRYEAVENANLFFEVDYNDLDPRSPYVIPKAANFPEAIVLQRFFPIRLEYLIIKEL